MSDTHAGISRFRALRGGWHVFERLLLIGLPVMGVLFVIDVPFHLGMAILAEQYYGVFLALSLGALYTICPATRSGARTFVPWYDCVLIILSFAVGLYVAIWYPDVLMDLGTASSDKVILGTITIVLILEGLRRLSGWILVTLGLVFILYARFSWLAPATIAGPGIPWDRLSVYLFLDPAALLGLPMAVTAIVLLPFILFGNLMFGIGGGALLNDVAMAGFGRFRGGSAKIAVVASSLFGMISGTAISNVATVGVITIPMMKKSGYRPHIAAAIEAVASTGGQLMPPVMGVTAFIMAEFTGIPYAQIALAALIPSVLYYAALFIQIDLEAGKTGLRGLPREELPSLRSVLPRCWLFMVPLLVLVYTLFFMDMEPGKSAAATAFSVLLLSVFVRETRLRIAWILDALENTGRALLEITVIVALAGIIIGVVNYTGLGFLLTISIVKLSGGNVYMLLLIVAAVSFVLGMGMPTAAVYVLLAVLLGPALIELGISKMAAHMFIQYMGMLSLFTPPVAFAAFAAAAIAQADPMRTGLSAMRLGVIIYVVPFLFVFSPALLFDGSAVDIILTVVTALVGCFMLGVGLVGYLFREISLWGRLFFTLAGIGLMIPIEGAFTDWDMFANIAGGALTLLLLYWEWHKGKRQSQTNAARAVKGYEIQ